VKHGDPLKLGKKTRTVIKCLIEGCSSESHSRGFCPKHYEQEKCKGGSLFDLLYKGECHVEGCKEAIKSKNYCSNHYAKYKRHGDPEGFSIFHTTCQIDGCSKKHVAHGLCRMHYSRKYSTGDIGEPEQKVFKHGLSKTPEYKAWSMAKQRCYNNNHPEYKNYGGRGLIMCDGWLNDSLQFIEDLGEKPFNNYSIDRIDNSKNYSCGKCAECHINNWTMNCRWTNDFVQGQNRRPVHIIRYQGSEKTLSEWSVIVGLSREVLRHRIIRAGWDISTAMTTPLRKRDSK
jgi:hypothetical protein